MIKIIINKTYNLDHCYCSSETSECSGFITCTGNYYTQFVNWGGGECINTVINTSNGTFKYSGSWAVYPPCPDWTVPDAPPGAYWDNRTYNFTDTSFGQHCYNCGNFTAYLLSSADLCTSCEDSTDFNWSPEA